MTNSPTSPSPIPATTGSGFHGMSTLRAGQHQEDLTRKQRREQGRALRKAIEGAEAAGTRRTRVSGRDRRVRARGGTRGRGDRPGGRVVKKVAPEEPPGARRYSGVGTLLAGLPQNGNVLGGQRSRDAPVLRRPRVPGLQVVHRRGASVDHPQVGARGRAAGRVPLAGDRDARTGSVRSQQSPRSLPASSRRCGTSSRPSTTSRGRGFGLRDRRLHPGIAKRVQGLNLTRWRRDRDDPALAEQLESDAQAASSDDFNGTPAFLIGGPAARHSRLEPSSFTEPPHSTSDRKAASTATPERP